MTLLEPIAKKRAFLKEVARVCGMNLVEVRGERLEDFTRAESLPVYDAATARAVGPSGRAYPACLALPQTWWQRSFSGSATSRRSAIGDIHGEMQKVQDHHLANQRSRGNLVREENVLRISSTLEVATPGGFLKVECVPRGTRQVFHLRNCLAFDRFAMILHRVGTFGTSHCHCQSKGRRRKNDHHHQLRRRFGRPRPAHAHH